MFYDTNEYTAPYTVAFTCVDCGGNFFRAVRSEPEYVCRCLRCDERNMLAVSERLLAEVSVDIHVEERRLSDGEHE